MNSLKAVVFSIILILSIGNLKAYSMEELYRSSAPGIYAKPADIGVANINTFSSKQPLVATYLFYWYNHDTREAFYDGEGKDILTHHPTETDGYSWANPDWYYREFKDMMAAGIDVVLPVYWGYPDFRDNWSFGGLAPLVEAQERMLKEGLNPPKIGLFYGCAGLMLNNTGYKADLTTLKGKEWLYVSIRDYYSYIPPQFRACIDGKPIIWLYTSEYSPKYDQSTFDYVYSEFHKDFGVDPYIVKEMTWNGKTDSAYAWGAAITGPTDFGVISLGPGFNSSGIGGKIYRKRDSGKYYRQSWEYILAKPVNYRSKIAVIETWNELYEGTDICDTMEFGREYIKMTRKYADLFHADKVLDGKSIRKTASIVLGPQNISDGLIQNNLPEGITKPVTIKGVTARQTVKTKYEGRYIYFNADDFLLHGSGAEITVNVGYFDNSKGSFSLEYDSLDLNEKYNGAFKVAGIIKKTGTHKWKNACFTLPSPAFSNRVHENDFRLMDISHDLIVSKIDIASHMVD